MARRMEAAGDTAGALAALERARKLDPAVGGDRRGDRRQLFAPGPPGRGGGRRRAGAQARQGQRRSAPRARARVFGVGRWRGAAAAGQTMAGARDARRSSISPPFRATPLMATNPNLQMTLGRLQLRAGKADVAVPILEKVAQQVPWAAEPLVLLYEAQIDAGHASMKPSETLVGRGADQSALLARRSASSTSARTSGRRPRPRTPRPWPQPSSPAATCRFVMPPR